MMKCQINKTKIELSQEDLEKNLLQFIREDLNLTGTKDSCGIGACGACVILVDEKPIRSCIKQVKEIVGKKVMTIEGMENVDGSLHPLQQAFLDAGAIQCGFCTPGMVLVSHAFLLKNNKPTREEIRQALVGNLCRCTGYQQIIDAVENASKLY